MSFARDEPIKETAAGSTTERWPEVIYSAVTGNSQALAERIMALHFQRNARLEEAYGPRQRAFYLEDTRHTLESMAAAILFDAPQMFADYVSWLESILKARNIPTAGLPLHFECLRDVLHEALPTEAQEIIDLFIRSGIEQLS